MNFASVTTVKGDMTWLENKRGFLARHGEIIALGLLIFEHHPEIAAGYLHTTERPDRFRVEPIDIERQGGP